MFAHMRKKGDLQLALQFNFWVAPNTCMSCRIATHYSNTINEHTQIWYYLSASLNTNLPTHV
jgi:hypothetical protein